MILVAPREFAQLQSMMDSAVDTAVAVDVQLVQDWKTGSNCCWDYMEEVVPGFAVVVKVVLTVLVVVIEWMIEEEALSVVEVVLVHFPNHKNQV